MLNKNTDPYRPTSARLKKENSEWLKKECSRLGISLTTALNWLIEREKARGRLQPPDKSHGDIN